jgi:uncharacterized protein DUF1761
MNDVDINWIAVVVAALVPMVVGMAWYGRLLGDAWLRAVGKTREEIGSPGPGYALALAAALLNSILLALLVDWAGADTFGEGLLVGLFAWGFVATTAGVNSLFAGRSRALYTIDAGYHLVTFTVMAVILAVWN